MNHIIDSAVEPLPNNGAQAMRSFLTLEFFGMFLALEARAIWQRAQEQNLVVRIVGPWTRRRDRLLDLAETMFTIGNQFTTTEVTVREGRVRLRGEIRDRPYLFRKIRSLGEGGE